MKTFLGVNVKKQNNNQLHLSQPHLIFRILEVVYLDPEEQMGRNTKDTPSIKPLLIKDTNRENC